tara:strand:+ start:3060 stop:3206 length:147 start_codon:yes stop_codon:yes gene_type:complete
MLDDPDKLYRFAEGLGLATEPGDSPQKVVSKLLQLAVRVDNIPDYTNM